MYLCHTMFYSQLFYGLPVWKKHIHHKFIELETDKTKPYKIVERSKWSDHVTLYYQKTRNPLNNLFKLEIAKMIFKFHLTHFLFHFKTIFEKCKLYIINPPETH